VNLSNNLLDIPLVRLGNAGQIGHYRTDISPKSHSGQAMYVVDPTGNIVIGYRYNFAPEILQFPRSPHPTLLGGNPQVLGAGIIDIRGGRIFSINNSSGHFHPSSESLIVASHYFNNFDSSIA
jgi:hypothetical protein